MGVGPPTYSLTRNLLLPEKLIVKIFGELVTLLQNHFNPTPIEIVEHFNFNSQCRKPREFATEFITELRKNSQNWCHMDTDTKQSVCGVNYKKILLWISQTQPPLKSQSSLRKNRQAKKIAAHS